MLEIIPTYKVSFATRNENKITQSLRVSENHLMSFVHVLFFNGIETVKIEKEKFHNED